MSFNREANRELTARLASYQNGLCFLCGQKMSISPPGNYKSEELNGAEVASLKRVVPQSFNGSNGSANLVVVHRGCNSVRGARGLTDDESVRLDALNKARKIEIAQRPGAIDRGTFRYCNGDAFQVLMEILGEENKETHRYLKTVLATLARVDRRLIDLQKIQASSSFEYMVSLAKHDTFANLERRKGALPDKVEQYLRNVLTSAFRKASNVSFSLQQS